MTKMARQVFLAAAKAIGIVLVTIGHAEPVGTAFPTLWKTIYSFHMPLFFLLTGIFSTRLEPLTLEHYWIYLKRQVRLLLVPYLFVSFAFAAFKFFAPGPVKRAVHLDSLLTDVLFFPSSAPALFLWFVFTLFVIRVSWPAVSRVPALLALPLLGLCQWFDVDIPVLLLGYVLYFLPYYWLGSLAAPRLGDLRKALGRPLWSVLALALFVGANLVEAGHEFPPPLRLPVALSGIWLVLAICNRLEAWLDGPVVALLDRQSFQIYLLQYFFIFPVQAVCRRWGVPDEATVILNVAIGLAGPLLVVWLGMRWMPRVASFALGVKRERVPDEVRASPAIVTVPEA